MGRRDSWTRATAGAAAGRAIQEQWPQTTAASVPSSPLLVSASGASPLSRQYGEKSALSSPTLWVFPSLCALTSFWRVVDHESLDQLSRKAGRFEARAELG